MATTAWAGFVWGRERRRRSIRGFQHYVRRCASAASLAVQQNEEYRARGVRAAGDGAAPGRHRFVANWQDKAATARPGSSTSGSTRWSSSTTTGRALVRSSRQVAVPELPDDPSYIRALGVTLLDTSALAGEDLRQVLPRNAARAGRGQRHRRGGVSSRCGGGPRGAHGPPWSNGTARPLNQFNPTTRRYSAAECWRWRGARTGLPHRLLTDRFGDNGDQRALACIEGDTLRLDTWLMSCRVLKRRRTAAQPFRPWRGRGLRRIAGVNSDGQNTMVGHTPGRFLPHRDEWQAMPGGNWQ